MADDVQRRSDDYRRRLELQRERKVARCAEQLQRAKLRKLTAEWHRIGRLYDAAAKRATTANERLQRAKARVVAHPKSYNARCAEGTARALALQNLAERNRLRLSESKTHAAVKAATLKLSSATSRSFKANQAWQSAPYSVRNARRPAVLKARKPRAKRKPKRKAPAKRRAPAKTGSRAGGLYASEAAAAVRQARRAGAAKRGEWFNAWGRGDAVALDGPFSSEAAAQASMREAGRSGWTVPA